MGIAIGVVIGIEGFRPVGGGFRSSDSPETLCIVANVGFVDFTVGFRGLFASGDGVRFRMGDGDPLILDDAFAGVAEAALLTAGRWTFDLDAAFCSNIPIKDVVGGIGVVSRA